MQSQNFNAALDAANETGINSHSSIYVQDMHVRDILNKIHCRGELHSILAAKRMSGSISRFIEAMHHADTHPQFKKFVSKTNRNSN